MAQKKRAGRRWWVTALLVVGLLVSIALIFNEQIKVWVIGQMSDSAVRTAQTATATDYQKNKKHKANYDFDAVEALDVKNVSQAALDRNLHPIGLISVPSVHIALPILNGLGGANLTVGAGTMKANMVMGQGNYALAGHHMENPNILFSPLMKVKPGAQVYITDKQTVYTYTVQFVKIVDQSQVQYVDDRQGDKILTLVTCSSGRYMETQRAIVRGVLTATHKASNKTLKVFGAA